MNSLQEERGDKFKKEEYIVKEGAFTKSNRHSPLGADKPRVSLNDSIDRKEFLLKLRMAIKDRL